MAQVAIHGAAGRMGQSIASVLNEHPEATLVAAMDREGSELIGSDMGQLMGRASTGVCITSDVEEFLSNVEVVIDFSTAAASAKLLPLCAGQHIPMVIGTTGLDAETRAALERAAERVPIHLIGRGAIRPDISL